METRLKAILHLTRVEHLFSHKLGLSVPNYPYSPLQGFFLNKLYIKVTNTGKEPYFLFSCVFSQGVECKRTVTCLNDAHTVIPLLKFL